MKRILIISLFSLLSLSSCVKETFPDDLVGRWKYSNASSGYIARFEVGEDASSCTLFLKSPVQTLFDREGTLYYESQTGQGSIIFEGEPTARANVSAASNGRSVKVTLFEDSEQIFMGSFVSTYIW